MELKDLTPEQAEKLKACETPEEFMARAGEEGLELSMEQLDQVAGGFDLWGELNAAFGSCRHCGKFGLTLEYDSSGRRCYWCPDCGQYTWFK